MRKNILFLLLIFTAICANAQSIPDIRIKTSIYEKDGPTNAFTLVLGAAPGKSGYADIKCSGGNSSEAEIATAQYDSETMALIGTNVSCQVDEQGIVEVFCDDDVVIDYLSCTGAEITSIEFKNPEAIEILALEHNILEGLDLTRFTNLKALYLNDNPMNISPLKDNTLKPNLQILEISQIENIDPDFDIVGYPNLVVFDAMSTHGLKKLTPAACPNLQKISIDNTSVSTLDVRNNKNLYILNISETRIKEIDLSQSKMLQQLYATHSSAANTDIKLSEIDVTHCPDLFYLFLNDNNLTTLDISKCPKLQDLYVRNNRLTSIDLSQNTNLVNVFISGNYMDFNTLPVPADTWGDYDYKQRALEVPQAYLVGKAIDLSNRIVRSDMETVAAVFTVSEDNPYLSIPLDESKYTFKDGVLTISEILADSVYASFYNAVFPEIELQTTRFKVKDESTFGQDDKVIVISNALTSGTPVKMCVGMVGATPETPKKFYVQLGSSTEKKEYIATSENTPVVANVDDTKSAFGSIVVYVPEGEKVSAFKMADLKISGIDMSACRQLKELSLINTQLTKLDLQWNRCLESVEITGNNFGDSFTLAGANGSYGKNVLAYINLSNNNMSSVKLNEPGSWRYIDLSNNKLSLFDFTDADYVEYLDVSHNNFEYLKINYLGQLKTLYCNDNIISNIVLPETNVIEYFNCANNRFTFATMPDRNGLDEEHFIYAPQATMDIPTKGPGYNLSGQNVTINGSQTVFTWKTINGETLVADKDYICLDGVTHFNDNTIGKTLYCEMSHAAYPQFKGENVLKTTPIYSAGMPTHLLASFKTLVGGQETRLSMTSAVPNNAIYIDWTGTQSLEQYPITNATYTVYNPVTTEGADVKVWSYDENDNLTVFSLSDATLDNVDCSPMTHLSFFGLANCGANAIVWPESPNLTELSIEGCNLSSFDFSRYPNLYFVNFDNNEFETIDFTGLNRLGFIGMANNKLTEIKFGNNTNLWNLALTGNQLQYIDFTGAPNIEQLYLNDNQFSRIDLSPLSQLRVIYLDGNRFDFSSLPIPQSQWALYTYGNQPELKVTPVNGIVDLSSQAEREGVKTVYTWFYGAPAIDADTGEISGELLIEDDEYTTENGVTTFFSDLDKVCCVLTNELFPKAYLQTNLFSVEASNGIKNVTVDKSLLAVTVSGRTITVSGSADGTVFTAYTTTGAVAGKGITTNGNATITVTNPGIYLITTTGAVAKVTVR